VTSEGEKTTRSKRNSFTTPQKRCTTLNLAKKTKKEKKRRDSAPLQTSNKECKEKRAGKQRKGEEGDAAVTQQWGGDPKARSKPETTKGCEKCLNQCWNGK